MIVAFGLASLPMSGTAFAGQGQGGHGQKAAAHTGKAGKAGKHHGKKHHAKHAVKHHKNK